MTKRRPRHRRRSGRRSNSPGPAKVFISHAREDLHSARLNELLRALDNANLGYWFDGKQLGPGEHFPSKLVNGFGECDACVFLLTENSQSNVWCAVELAAFWGAKKLVYILTVDPKLEISRIAPQLSGITPWQELDQLMLALAERPVRGPASSPQVNTMTGRNLKNLIVQSARQVTGKLEQQVSALNSRLAGLLPFDDQSIFGERYEHFFHEKRAIAACFIERLDEHIKITPEGEKIRLILDSGTTIFPVFGLLLEHKHDQEWTSKLEIVTNNIPGVLVMLRDGRAKENPHSELAFDVHVVAGDPSPAYWALLPSAPEQEMARVTREKAAATIGVTTGNWAMASGKGLFVRGDRHADFKKALMACSSVLYALLPVGKMIEQGIDELNDRLAGGRLYAPVDLPTDKKRVLVTTRRDRRDKMHEHWTMLKHGLSRLSETDRKFELLLVEQDDFSISGLLAGSRFNEEDLEMPHRPHRDVLKGWFCWNSSDDPA